MTVKEDWSTASTPNQQEEIYLLKKLQMGLVSFGITVIGQDLVPLAE